ncbi:GHKL domain-containing protein [Aerococcaceae bacterium DSM 109653]|uniref:histidine kinase n=1 Tax=Fundicoccus ignavus TaxID=2664442 RepID=A0A844BI60_9LACT|nr:HAMP domain-containing sensor histidine kinase [Fundicoccus ignavus]MRI81685.1 GHKL domain-containing protein [Fundicoccus ignavus]
MIEKLRHKFIYTTMASVFVVMGVILVILNVVNYTSATQRADEILTVLSENQGEFPELLRTGPPEFSLPNGVPNLNAEVPFETRFFKVTLSDNGDVKRIDTSRISSIDSETAMTYAETVYASDELKGYVDDYRFWSVEQSNGDYLVLFVDNFRELTTFRNFLFSSVLIGIASLTMIALLVIYSSKRIVAPVQENLDRQKQFITDAGHEIKTPLTIISANNDVQELLEGKTEWTESTRKQIIRLDGLVEDMLSLARIDEGNFQHEMQTLDFSHLVEQTSQAFKLINEQQGRRFTIQIEPALTVKADEKALEKVCAILLDNATKYVSEQGEISLTLKREKKKAVLNVMNTVEEMPENLERLFDRFYRENQSRTQSTGGYGIGLSLAQAIVEQHEGKISVASRVDTQSCIEFSVQLPLAN